MHDFQDVGSVHPEHMKGGEMDIFQITELTIGRSFKVHNQYGFGFLEKVYKNALAIKLKKREFAKQQHPLPVF